METQWHLLLSLFLLVCMHVGVYFIRCRWEYVQYILASFCEQSNCREKKFISVVHILRRSLMYSHVRNNMAYGDNKFLRFLLLVRIKYKTDRKMFTRSCIP